MKRRWIIALALCAFIVSRISFGSVDVQVVDGHNVLVLDHGYHSGIVIYRDDLQRFGGAVAKGWLADFPNADWFEIGWGDRGFYLDVPTLSDVTFGVAASALLLPSPSVLHVATGQGDAAQVFAASGQISFSLDSAHMTALIDTLQAGSGGADGLKKGLYLNSLFYAGNGSYHMFYTCNSWVARVLRAGGVNASPLFAQSSSGLFTELNLRY